jgi:hypothetical protein
MKIDSGNHAFVVEELDDQTLVVKDSMLAELKRQLDEVSIHVKQTTSISNIVLRCSRRPSNHQKTLVPTSVEGVLRLMTCFLMADRRWDLKMAAKHWRWVFNFTS